MTARVILFRDPSGKVGPCPDGLECMHPWHGRVTPVRIQRRRTAGWRMPEGAVYVGRPSRWGNPFSVAGVVGGSVIGPRWFDVKDWPLTSARCRPRVQPIARAEDVYSGRPPRGHG